jgi:hypothetical protein
MLSSGCAVQASFEPETIEVNGHTLVIKGWTEKGEFCIELSLRPGDEATSLHSVSLVTADGQGLDPGRWEDKTPEPPRMSVGFGVGFGGRRERHGYHEGPYDGRSGRRGSTITGTGVSFPLGGRKGDRVTAIEACWKLTDAVTPIARCTLEVRLVSVVIKKAEVTTVPLAMVFHVDDEDDDAPGDEEKDDKSAKELVREVDFTMKGPPKTKSQDL